MSGGAGSACLAALCICLWTGACSKPLPPVPQVALNGFDPEVRDAVSTAQNQALAAPESGQASGRLGMVLQAHALYQPAEIAYERAMRLEPKEFSWAYYHALVVWQLSGPAKALEPLTSALKLHRGYAPAILKRADLLYELGKFSDSADAYKSVLTDDPGAADALYGMGRVKFAQHDMTAAEDFYRRACQAYPRFGAAHYGLAMAEKSSGHEAEAANDFELAQRLGEDRPPRTDPLGEQVAALATGVYQRLAQGDRLAHNGQAERAAELNEELLKHDPENLSFVLNLLYLARLRERPDHGELDGLFDQAKRINPQVALIYDYYGAALVHQEKYEAAAAPLRKALELNPELGEAHALLAEILERQNRPAEAIEHYERALATQPSNRELEMNLWRSLIVHGRSRDAIPQLLPALQFEDEYATLRRVLLGEAYLTTGDRDHALQYLEQARSRAQKEGPPALVAQIDQELEQISRRR